MFGTGDRVEAAAVRGANFDALQVRGWSQPRDAGLIGRCLRERTWVLVNDVRAESRCWSKATCGAP